MIRKCQNSELDTICEIVNDGAQAYRDVIPADCWEQPYMSLEECTREIEGGVVFWGFESAATLLGVMGIQDKGDVTLIRHAYVRSRERRRGIGTKLLKYLQSMTDKPVLVGTWADATWAIAFYKKNGFRLVSESEKNRLLGKYWRIPTRQIETSVVLADETWDRPADSYIAHPRH